MDNARIRVKDVFKWLNLNSTDETIVEDISLDSSFVGRNWIYIAYRGNNFDGNKYIEEAKSNGAISIISDNDLPNLKDKICELGKMFYGEIDIELIGVTGTSGKSTIAYLLHSFYSLLSVKTLLVTTTKGIKRSVFCKNTTPDTLTLFRILKMAKIEGYQKVIMECSSIGIAENRLNPFKFKDILISDITSDHLDYHKTIKNYRMTKINFATNFSENIYILKNNKSRKYLAKGSKTKVVENKVSNLKCSLTESKFTYLYTWFKTNLLLPFNTRNIVLVLGYFLNKGISINVLKRKLELIKPLPGRIEKVSDNIFVDYAHTHDALKHLLKEIKHICPYPLIVVFGAGGERDTSKRLVYKRILKKYADIVILTNDNPRREDPVKILKDLKGKELFLVIPNRKAAIEFALNLYFEERIVLIVGKGDEDYQEINGIKYHFSDKEVIAKCLKK